MKHFFIFAAIWTMATTCHSQEAFWTEDSLVPLGSIEKRSLFYCDLSRDLALDFLDSSVIYKSSDNRIEMTMLYATPGREPDVRILYMGPNQKPSIIKNLPIGKPSYDHAFDYDSLGRIVKQYSYSDPDWESVNTYKDSLSNDGKVTTITSYSNGYPMSVSIEHYDTKNRLVKRLSGLIGSESFSHTYKYSTRGGDEIIESTFIDPITKETSQTREIKIETVLDASVQHAYQTADFDGRKQLIENLLLKYKDDIMNEKFDEYNLTLTAKDNSLTIYIRKFLSGKSHMSTVTVTERRL